MRTHAGDGHSEPELLQSLCVRSRDALAAGAGLVADRAKSVDHPDAWHCERFVRPTMLSGYRGRRRASIERPRRSTFVFGQSICKLTLASQH